MFLRLDDLDYREDAGTEPSPDVLRARIACQDTVVSTFALIDAGQASRARSLFTDGCVHAFNGAEFTGPAVTALLASRDRQHAAGRNTRHSLATMVFRLLGPGRALVRSVGSVYVLSQEDEDQRRVPGGLVDVRDVLERDADGRWRIARRDVDLIAASRAELDLHQAGFGPAGGAS